VVVGELKSLILILITDLRPTEKVYFLGARSYPIQGNVIIFRGLDVSDIRQLAAADNGCISAVS
jgi:hypothetical protein